MFAPTLHAGAEKNVGDGWRTVTLPSYYRDMVVIAVPVYDEDDDPAVVRIRNASGNTFELRVQNPSGESLSGYDVNYLVVEAGVYSAQEDGIKMEAVKRNVASTNHSGDWSGERIEYRQNYTNPVVLGQVMSYEDKDWSVFWSRGGLTSIAPGDIGYLGKHVGEDNDQKRGAETVGYLVIEAGQGRVPGYDFQAFVGDDIVEGMENDPPYWYGHNLSGFDVAILSGAGVDGVNGGWPVLWEGAVSSQALGMAIDEDQIGDSERVHITEQVATLLLREIELPAPELISFFPSSGPEGTRVQVQGAYLDQATGVALNGAPANFDVVSAGELAFTVPAGATSGPIRIVTPGGEAVSQASFDVIQPAVLSSMSPTRGEAGSVVRLSGAGLDRVQAVLFEEGEPAEFVIVSEAELAIDVPDGARSGFLSLLIMDGEPLVSPEPFIVTFAGAASGMNLCRLTAAETSQSSLALPFAVSRKACDGIREGSAENQSFAATNVEPAAWWEADLGAVYDIDRIEIWNRTDCCNDQFQNVVAFVSEGPFVSKSVDLTLADPSVSAYLVPGVDDVFRIDVGRPGRHVRLQHLAEGALNPSEVEIVAADGRIINVRREEEAPHQGRDVLETAFPSPATYATTIPFRLSSSGAVRLVVYDVLGREVRVLLDAHRAAGAHHVVFDTSDVPAGVYLYRLTTAEVDVTRSMSVR